MNRARRERWEVFGMVLPTVVVLASVALLPVLASGWLSLFQYVVVFGERRFMGLAHYACLLHDARFHAALGTTVYFAVVAVALELVLALPVAMLLHARFRGRGFLRASVLVPWAVPTVVSGKLWALLFRADGPLAAVLPGIDWLGTPGLALHAAILVDVWKTTPFVSLLLLAGLVAIPEDVIKAARVDGAGPLRIFTHVTLPLLRPSLVLALLFRTLDALRVFDAIYVLTEGGPANTTETLSIYAYKTLMRTGNFGYGSALSVVTFLCVLAIAVVYVRMLERARP